jgi:thioredoxin-related protein
MKKTLLFAFILVHTLLKAQEEKGIKFEHGLTWEQIRAKAKAENKYIFLDAFTTWCGPCKAMAKDVFPLAEVGEFYNANFLNVKVQLDVTKNDDEEVKGWYKTAETIKNKYKINVYPSYLFFDPSGELVHRISGGAPAKRFISWGKDALEPEKQYYSLKKLFDSGRKDPGFLLALAYASQAAYDSEFSPAVIKEYLATQENIYTKDALKLLERSTKKSSDIGFDIFRNHSEKADSVLGRGRSASLVRSIVMNEVVYRTMYPKGLKEAVDWILVEENLSTGYADISEELILEAKASHYQRFKNWPEFSKTVDAYIAKYSNRVSNGMLNNFAWAIFEHCEDKNCVLAALEWSKKSLTGADSKKVMYMDTYANLLYKSGNKSEAIKVQEDAVRISGENDGDLTKTLNKMKKGEQTW